MNKRRTNYIQIILAFIIAMLTSLHTLAQVNIEKLRTNQTNTVTPTHEINLSGSFYSGNTDALQYKIKSKSVFQFNNTQIFGILSLQEKQSNEKKYVNKGFAHLRFITPINDTFSTDLFSQKQFNEFKLLKDRTLFGAGIRANLSNTDLYRITVGAGAMLENEEHDIDDTIIKSQNIRSTNFIDVHYNTTNTIQLKSTTYIQPKINDFSSVRLLMENQFKVKLTSHLNLTTNLNLSHSTKPKKSIQKSDIELFTGLNIEI